MNRKFGVRILSVLVLASVLISSLSIALISSAQDFVPENVFATHVSSVKGVIMNHETSAVSDHNQFNGSGKVFSAMFDGNKNVFADVYGANDWGNYAGALIELDDAYYCGEMNIYSGLAALKDTYDVYASDTLDDLYSAENKIGDGVVCTKSGVTVAVHKDVRYVALFLTAYTGNGRMYEVELWTEEKAEEGFVSENLLKTAASEAQGILFNSATHAYGADDRFDQNGAVAAATDGNTETACAVTGATATEKIGVLYTLDNTYMVDSAKIYSGLAGSADYWTVYAAAKLDDLFADASIYANNLKCENECLQVEIDGRIRYIAFILNSNSGNIRELELWSAEDTTPIFQSENAFQTKLASVAGVNMFVSNGTTEASTRFNVKGAYTTTVDGDVNTAVDVYGALDWDPARYVGALYTLTETVLADHITIYAGVDGYEDTWRVYASDSLENLYTAGLVGEYVCGGEAVDVPLNKNVRYVAFFGIAYNGNLRVKEFQLWTGDDSNEFHTENLFRTKLSGANGVNMFISNGTVEDSTRFNGNGAIATSVDGDLTKATDIYGALDWDPARYVGACYTLTESAFADRVTIYSGTDSLPETWRVYASDNLSDLYTAANLIGEVQTGDVGVDLTIGKKVRYVAFFCTDYSGNTRLRELELWSGEDTSQPETGKTASVLTIGNSFSENAASYATEIAAAQGHNLTFGYLKYPGCTIAQHYENATKNKAVYKFEYTDYNGAVARHTVKNGSSTYATIKEALALKDWDIVVIQQGSMASYKYETYEKTDELIAYVKAKLPNAKIMVHETWSWETWAADSLKDNNFKYIEDCYHQIAAANGNLTIIPSGRAFEFARKAGIGVNESDHQHANAYGQYLAGACYVAKIFGANIYNNPFGDNHPAFKNVDMSVLREAVMNAIYFNYNPATNWDWTEPVKNPSSSKNFIARHVESSTGIIQDIPGGGVMENGRFSVADPSAADKLIDGDTEETFEVYGALDWDPPKNVGVMYSLDAVYKIDKMLLTGGAADNPLKVDVYASDAMGNLYSSKIASGVTCKGKQVTVKIGKEIRYVAILVTKYNEGSSIRLAEMDLVGSDKAIEVKEISWPKAPKTANLLKKARAYEIIAPGGDYAGAKEYDYRFMDGQTETDFSKLVDGRYDKVYDVWSLTSTDKPGVLYELDAYYDLSHLHVYAGVYQSDLVVNNGYKIYASDSLADLYKTKSLVYSYQNDKDTTNECGVNVNLKKVKYIAFFLTNSSDGGWRMREFEAYGTKSADQSEPVEEKSIIEDIEPEYYGVAFDNLADPVYSGASAEAIALSDGSRDPIEFWGGSDINNSKFVFIYNLYANYDLTGVDIYANADNIEEDTGIHKGIKSAKVYSSRKFEDLFNTKPLVLKEDYNDPNLPDEEAYYTADADASWKGVRYIAYVFTIGDSRYGACRLEELKAFGKMSAVQDGEEEETKLPQYIDVSAENGIVVRIFQSNPQDDLAQLDAKLAVETDDTSKTLDFVNKALADYKATCVYNVAVQNSAGLPINLDGRLLRLSIPAEDESVKLACVDDYGAEIVSTGKLNNCVTVETETLRAYALVNHSGNSEFSIAGSSTLFLVLIIVLSVLLLGAVAATAVFAVKAFKK